MPRHRPAEAGAIQPLVAPQQLVHAARAEAEAGAQILHPGLAEVHKVVGHQGGLAGKLHGGEKHRQLLRRLLRTRLASRRSVSGSWIWPTNSTSWPQLNLCPSDIRSSSTCSSRCESPPRLLSEARLKTALLNPPAQVPPFQQQSTNRKGGIQRLARGGLRRGEYDGVGQRAAAQQFLDSRQRRASQKLEDHRPVFLPHQEVGERLQTGLRQPGIAAEQTLQASVAAAPHQPARMLRCGIGDGQAKALPLGNSLLLPRSQQQLGRSQLVLHSPAPALARSRPGYCGRPVGGRAHPPPADAPAPPSRRPPSVRQKSRRPGTRSNDSSCLHLSLVQIPGSSTRPRARSGAASRKKFTATLKPPGSYLQAP